MLGQVSWGSDLLSTLRTPVDSDLPAPVKEKQCPRTDVSGSYVTNLHVFEAIFKAVGEQQVSSRRSLRSRESV
jgi:hypothetical protein